ncbi:MAG: hypothetical protein PVG65_00805 [Candidatus Thorarchaeota archaeon]|jgi:hypothetical protein
MFSFFKKSKKLTPKKKPLVWFDTDKYNWNVKCPNCGSIADLNKCVRWNPITKPPTGHRIGCTCGRHIFINNGIVIPDEFVEDGEKFKCVKCGGYGRVRDGHKNLLGTTCDQCNGEGIVDWIYNIRGK